MSNSFLSVKNSPYGAGDIRWNCIFYQGGYAWMWTPGYIPITETWLFNIATSMVSVTLDIQITDAYGFLYQRFGVPATIKEGASYLYNCLTHQVEEIAPEFSQFSIDDYLKV